MSGFNLPPGVTIRDVEGPPMPRCKRCGFEHNDDFNNGRCDECQPPDNEDAQELLRASLRYEQVKKMLNRLAVLGLENTDGYRKLWAEFENLKNIAGGMPTESEP